MDFDRLVHPQHTALVTQECQRGVIGEHVTLPALAEATRSRGTVGTIAALVHAARRAAVPVVHCLVTRRPDGRGSSRNARLLVAAERSPNRLVEGTAAAELLEELGPEESDFVLRRLHGLSPMHDTELDALLRNLGCTTVVGVGVSLNVAILNLAFDAVNSGYQMVVPQDAVAGVPLDYADAVLEHSLSLVATLTTADDLAAAWDRSTHDPQARAGATGRSG